MKQKRLEPKGKNGNPENICQIFFFLEKFWMTKEVWMGE